MNSPRDYSKVYVETAPYTTTDSFDRVPGAIVDVRNYAFMRLGIRVANQHATNVIAYKVRGSLDGVNFTDIITLLLAGTEQVATGATVAGNSAAEVFVTEQYDTGAPASFAYYDVVAKSNVAATPGTAKVHMSVL